MELEDEAAITSKEVSTMRKHEMLCNIEDAQTIHCLTANATVACSRCGVKAHNPADVCDPVQLPAQGMVGD